jgi:lysophospholipid acyltransferase
VTFQNLICFNAGALMVLTLKVISCSINYSDGILKEEGLRDAQKKNRLTKLPSLIEYFGYCLCCGSHFAGPVYEMKDYLEWTERKGVSVVQQLPCMGYAVLTLYLIFVNLLQIWASPTPSPLLPTLRALVQAGICMGLYLYLSPKFPLSRFSEPLYYEWGFWHRLFYQYMSGFTARWKYYFIWSISEASIIISGLGFTGWSESSPPKAKWDRAKNVDVLGVELAGSSVQLPLVWNIQVSTWLRYCKFRLLIKSITSPFVGR